MKIFLIFSLMFFTQLIYADLTEIEIRSMVVSMSNFSEKKLTKSDLPEITYQLKNLLILEANDPSRAGPFELKKSYPQNKALYKKAVKSFTENEQKILREVLDLIESVARNGNG